MRTNGFKKPNHTQTPNSFFDQIMRDINTLSELKVTLAVIRQTIGWHRNRVRYGVAKIERLTGLARNSVIAGAKAAEKRGTIQRIKVNGEAMWELVITEFTPSTAEESDFDPSTAEGVLPSAVEGVPPQRLRGIKERKKETKKKLEGGGNNAPKANQIPELLLFRKATGYYPARSSFPTVIDAIAKIKLRLGRDISESDIAPFLRAWTDKGWKSLNLVWLTEWAVSGEIPQNGFKKSIEQQPTSEYPTLNT